MSQIIDLGKLRFHFAGDWSNSTTYEQNDIVKYGGNVYVYTYGLKTSGHLPTDSSIWALMVEGFIFKGEYSNATAYRIGDGVAHGGKVYICILDTTGNTPPNVTYWSQFADGIQWEGAYNNASSYQKNDVVLYGSSAYIAKQDTNGNLPSNTTYWGKFVEGISATGVYNNGTAYVVGDLVAYGNNIYRALGDTTGNLPTDGVNWELFVSGTDFKGDYNAGTTYYINDIVLYASNAYRSLTEQSGVIPTNTGGWELVVEGMSYQGNWSSATQYYLNQVVTYGGSLFKAKSDNQNVNPTTTATWDKIVYGYKNRGNWATATSYGIDEVVTYGGNTFISILPHASGTFATDLADNKWIKFNSGVSWQGVWASGTFYKTDDIVKSGVSTYIATEDHTSSGAFSTDLAAAKWNEFAKGGDYVIPTTTALLKGDGAGDVVAATVGTDYLTPTNVFGTANTFTATQSMDGGLRLQEVLESATIDASTTGAITMDVKTQSIIFYNVNQTANRTVNLRGDGSTSLDALMAVGEAITINLLSQQGATAYWFNVFQVDGSTQTVKWANAAVTAGQSSSINLYTYTVIKTGSAAFTVLGAQTKYV